MRKWLPVQLGVCLALACALALFAILWPQIFVDSGARFCGVAAVALIAIFCIVNAIPESLYQVWLGLNTDVFPAPAESAPKAPAPKEKSVRPPSCEELQSVEVQTLFMELDSDDQWTATLALNALNERFGQPIMPISCWANETTTRLRRIAAEVLFREWLEIVTEFPGADDNEIIDRMFPVIPDKKRPEPKARRFRKLRETIRPPTPPPLVVRKLDEWSETVKNVVMDINIGEPAGEELLEGEDKALLPFDRQRFIDALRGRMQELLDFVADAVAEANTDYELLCNHKKIEPFLTNMSWEAIAIALEQRQAEPDSVNADDIRKRAQEMTTRWSSSQPLLARPTEGWARKYRRMKAQGL
jgi:hypothetical protein